MTTQIGMDEVPFVETVLCDAIKWNCIQCDTQFDDNGPFRTVHPGNG